MSTAEDDDDSISETCSLNSCEEFLSFESIRDPSTNLETSIRFSWPQVYEIEVDCSSPDSKLENSETPTEKKLRKITISTLLEEDDIAPIFDGSRWAGTRLWRAAIRGIQYITGHLDEKPTCLDIIQPDANKRISMIELGCGLGVPGMIYHLLGGNVVLTDQSNIMRQLQKNVAQNFKTTVSLEGSNDFKHDNHTIRAMPLSWSIESIHNLLEQLNLTELGFDVVLNCDCVFEPLYGKSWIPLNETINELLRINPKCFVVTSVERRGGDNIESFLEMMRGMEHVGTVEKVWEDREGKPIEIYITKGIST